MRCPSPEVQPVSREVQRWAAGQHLPVGVELVPLADVSDDALVQAWTAQYAWMHETWAPIASAAAVSTVGASPP